MSSFFRSRSIISFVVSFVFLTSVHANDKPNIIWIMADDLGYGDLGCYGQEVIQTPSIDKLASQGMLFTDCYAGSTVCAPSRCCLMTGHHSGHAYIRGNKRVPMRPEDVTIAEVLKEQGYTTGQFGKWGLGEPDTTGGPLNQGFDRFYGYTDQRHAHNYYPEFLWDDDKKITLEGNLNGKQGEYSHNLIMEKGLEFIRTEQGQRPFFLVPTRSPSRTPTTSTAVIPAMGCRFRTMGSMPTKNGIRPAEGARWQ